MSECTNCAKLEKRIEELLKRIESLEARLAKYENAHTPPSKSDFGKRKLIPKEQYKKSGQKEGHQGTTRPTPKPDETIEVKANQCPKCNSKHIEYLDIERMLVEEIPEPIRAKVIEFLLRRYACKDCGNHFVAKHPNCPEQGRFGTNFLTDVVFKKYEERLPYRKIVEAIERERKMPITASTILDITTRVCQKLSPEYKKIIKKIRRSRTIYIDETKIKVNGTQYWMWVFTTNKYTLIVIRPSRGKNVLEEVLGKTYAGHIVCDGYRIYQIYTQKLQRCWAHLIREAEFIARKYKEAIPLAKALKRLYLKLVKKVSIKIPFKERLKIRENATQTLKRWINKPTLIERIQKFKNLITNGLNYWFTFILNPRIQPTNNTAERALRESIVIRKIIGTYRNEKGTKNHETMMSLLATWKQQNLNPFTQLQKALTAT